MSLSYQTFMYFGLFLPIIIGCYQICPRKYRQYGILLASYSFFFVWSKFLVIYHFCTSVFVYVVGKWLLVKKKENVDLKVYQRWQKYKVLFGTLVPLGILVILKYTNFIVGNIAGILRFSFTAWHILIPIGISYYTLQMVSYLLDIYHKKNSGADSLIHFLMYTSYFPTLVQGPITRFHDVGNDIAACHDLTYENLTHGYQRILWGLLKKMVIADHLNPVVNSIFASHTQEGGLVLFGAILWTIQLYMDFAGTIDIGIGSAMIFGVKVNENFRQPFFAQNASEFWRRWHITLGTFFKDYIFYPISLSKSIMKVTKYFKKKKMTFFARYTGPMIALFFVWLSNGVWHGANWTYIFYGMYYFVLIFIELILEKPIQRLYQKFHIDEKGFAVRMFRFLKLSVIVVIGEMFFRAPSIQVGWQMFISIFTKWNFHEALSVIPFLGMDTWDYLTVGLAFFVVICMSFYLEKGHTIHDFLDGLPRGLRWAILYLVIFYIILFGAYGPGYDAIAMMYAGF